MGMQQGPEEVPPPTLFLGRFIKAKKLQIYCYGHKRYRWLLDWLQSRAFSTLLTAPSAAGLQSRGLAALLTATLGPSTKQSWFSSCTSYCAVLLRERGGRTEIGGCWEKIRDELERGVRLGMVKCLLVHICAKFTNNPIFNNLEIACFLYISAGCGFLSAFHPGLSSFDNSSWFCRNSLLQFRGQTVPFGSFCPPAFFLSLTRPSRNPNINRTWHSSSMTLR